MRAARPTEAGRLEIAGFPIEYEVFGARDAPPILLLPPWQIIDRRSWKMQVAGFARTRRVITYDGPRNTRNTAAFEYDRIVAQGIGLLDTLGVERTPVVGFSRGCSYGIVMAAQYPERVESLTLITNGVEPDKWASPVAGFREQQASYVGWEKYNAHYWMQDYEGWLEFLFGEVFNEPFSSKAIEDSIGWAREIEPEILALTEDPSLLPRMDVRKAIDSITCPVLLIHGADAQCTPLSCTLSLARYRRDWTQVVLEGSGQAPHLRDPVRVNAEIERFIGGSRMESLTWTRAPARTTRRALFVSSPIGLGHVHRDLAIARELRQLVPDLQIDWLAQPPVTGVLEQSGERIHPKSHLLASESAHWEEAASGHRLHCFNAFRDMDEILLANFSLFLDVVRETPYDLWIGDEAWEVDHFLHENPELKSAPYAFMTDFLGWLPVDRTPGSRDAWLAADYNAQMLAQIERFGRVRDRAIYIGELDDLIPERFGPGLPLIPEWAREHFNAVGYVLPFDPADYADTYAARERLGYDPARPLVVYAVGGSAVGRPLLDLLVEAWPLFHAEVPGARCLMVAGPRIAPDELPRHPGMDVTGYVHNLYEHLAVTDLAVVQGGLSTTMELTANRRPFLYFPIRDHVEQVYHVAYRLERYNAGRRLDYDSVTAADIAREMVAMCGADTSPYRPVTPGAARRAAALLAELL